MVMDDTHYIQPSVKTLLLTASPRCEKTPSSFETDTRTVRKHLKIQAIQEMRSKNWGVATNYIVTIG